LHRGLVRLLRPEEGEPHRLAEQPGSIEDLPRRGHLIGAHRIQRMAGDCGGHIGCGHLGSSCGSSAPSILLSLSTARIPPQLEKDCHRHFRQKAPNGPTFEGGQVERGWLRFEE
jgi:hypothetical protein